MDAQVLLVEDDAWDTRITLEAVAAMRPPHRVFAVSDGEEALAYLRAEGRFAGVPRPLLVILDLNLPRRDGRELLADVRADAALARIPVVVLTTSAAPADVAQAYDLGANAYLIKPTDPDEYAAAICDLLRFWLGRVILPS